MKKLLLLFASTLLFCWQANAQTCASPSVLVAGTQLTAEATCGTGAQLLNNPCNGSYVASAATEEAHIYSYTTGAFPELVTVDYTNISNNYSGVTIVSATACDDAAAVCLGSYYTGFGTANGQAATPLVPALTTIYVYITTWPTPNCVTSYDLLLSAVPVTCTPPSALLTNVLSSDSAVLSWTTGGATDWIVEWGPDGFVQGSGTIVNVSGASSDTLSGLTALTDYDWYVRDYCGPADSSDWVGPISFTTVAGCPEPTNLAALNLMATSADLSWSQLGSASEWEVEYGVAPYTFTGTPTMAGITDTFLNVASFTSETSYEFMVKTVCGPGDSSTWAGPFSFTTPCVTYVAPYSENFDALPLVSPYQVIPNCWTTTGPDFWEVTNETTNNPEYIPTIGDHTTGASNYMWVDASTTAGVSIAGNEMISPMIDMSGLTTPYVGFWFASSTTLSEYHGVALDVWDGSAWINVITFSGNFTGWQELASVLPPGIPSTTQFRIVGVNNPLSGFQNDLGVDDFFLVEAPTCFVPTALASANVTGSTADISWVEAVSATMWEVEYDVAGFSLGTGTSFTVSGTPDTTLMGLNDLTSYDFYVRAICGPGDSSLWSSSATFTTELINLTCAPGTGAPFYIYEESFEDNPGCTSTTSAPQWSGYAGFTNTSGTTAANWKIDCGGATTSGWIDAGPYDGNAYAYLETTGSTNPADTLTSAAFDISTLVGSARFTAYYLNGGTSTLTVQRSDDGGAWTTVFVNVGLGGSASPDLGEWTIMADDISALLGTVSSVAYRFIGDPTGSNTGDIGLDLLRLESCVSCVPPTAVTSTVISADSAQIDFTPFGPATNVIVEYGIAGFTIGSGMTDTTSADSIILTGLMSDATYEFYISSDCSASTGDSSLFDGPYTFTTPVTCPAPTGLTVDSISTDTALVYWTSGGAADFVIEYGEAGFVQGSSAGTVLLSTDTFTVLMGLNSGTLYDIYVRDYCGPADSSVWVSLSFGTLCDVYTAPYLENFDAALATPICWDNSFGTEPWSFQVSGGPGPDYLVSGAVDHTLGTGNFAWIDGSGTGIGTNELVSPDIDISGLNFPYVGYWILSNSADGAQNTIELSYWDGAAWVLLNTYGANNAAWIEVADSVPASAPAITKFKLVQVQSTTGVGSAFNNDLLADDFFVVEAPTCPGLSNIAVDSLGTDFAIASWTENGGATEWLVEAVPAGTGATGAWTSTTNNPHTFMGLSSNTAYDFYVQSYCGPADSSAVYFGGSFTTFPECGDTVGNLIYDLTSTAQVLLSFQATPGDFATLEFLAGQVETCCDEVLVYDGLNGTGNILYGSLTGGGLADYSGEGTIESTTGMISLVINSDISNTAATSGYTPFNVVVGCVPPPVSELGVTEVISPVTECGQEFTPISVVVENFGYATVYYAPVVVELSGDINDVFTLVLDSIPALSSDTLLLDSINTLGGGDFTVTAFTNLANDQDTSNDTTVIAVSIGEIPVAPVFAPVMACEGEMLNLTATNLGQLNWYTSDTATTAAFVGDTLMFTASSDTSFYVSQQETGSDTLTLDLYDDANDGWSGASLSVFVNGAPVTGSPFTLAAGGSGQETFFANHNDLISFLYTSGTFASEPAYNLVRSNGEIIFNDGGGFGSGTNTTPAGGFNQNVQIAGCPSELVLVEVTVGQTYMDTVAVTACDGMMINGVMVTTDGTYTDSLTSVGGCDSIVTIDLTIKNSSASTASLCGGTSATLADGTVVTTSGSYTATIANAAGCDSVITYTVTIDAAYDLTQNVQLCSGDSLVVGASVYTMNGTYMDTLPSAIGCDSIVTSIVSVFPAVNVSIGGVTTVCDNAGVIDLTLSPVGGALSGPGVSANSFDPAVAGVGSHTLSYTFTDGNGCDARASLDVEVVVCTGIENIDGIETISIYPNPYVSTINVMFEDATSSELTIKLFDITGRVLLTETVNTTIGTNDFAIQVPAEVSAGVTVMQIERDGAVYSTTLIKK